LSKYFPYTNFTDDHHLATSVKQKLKMPLNNNKLSFKISKNFNSKSKGFPGMEEGDSHWELSKEATGEETEKRVIE